MVYGVPSRLSPIQLTPCKVEALDPWDVALKPYLRPPKPMPCNATTQFLYVNDTGWLHMNHSMAEELDIDTGTLKCAHQVIRRENGDMKLTFGRKEIFSLPYFVKSHVFRVTCSTSGQQVYDMAHFNPFWNEYAKRDKEIEKESADKFSVIIFGIDSVSRSHAIRNLPKSYSFLKNEFDMYDFIGYSKIGENTWPNLVPLLTGCSHRDFPLIEHLHLHADSMPLLWNEHAMKHIASFFAEDRPDISTFNYVKSGFRKVPTDFYFRPYTLAMHEFEPKFIRPLGMPTWDCYGERNFFDLQVEYLKGFLNKYRGRRKLAYFWSNQAGHEDFTTLSRFDSPFLDFLKWLRGSYDISNTVFIVLSDHGFRIGGASLTHIGRAENNKPWLMMYVPNQLQERHPWINKSLSQNTKRLVSHFDTYQTVVDILNARPFEDKMASNVSVTLTRRNLFTEIPEFRTCADAGIEEMYCTCREKTHVSTETDLVKSLASKLVAGINQILSDVSDVCETLDLHNITEVTVVYSNIDELNMPEKQRKAEESDVPFFSRFLKRPGSSDKETGRYTVLFHTVPGFAYFEGTVDYSQFAPEASQFTVVGEPSRLDRYGTQSHCVQDSFLKLYCYCTLQQV